jgi:LysM repeat protein
MESPSKHRRARKFRRTGRHTTPSGVEKVAEAAGKAAPAVAIAGVLVTAAPAHAATTVEATATTVSGQAHHHTHTRHLQAHARSYTVGPGDTLAGIAQRFYGASADWTWIYDDNVSVIRNPNDIYAGEVLKIPYSKTNTAKTSRTSKTYTPKHDKASVLTSSASLSGTLGCSQLEELWQQAGGSQAEAFTAAEIAMAESGGNQYATGTAGERGYWQINPDHGSLSTYDPVGNAKAAIIISSDGTNWTAWTTYTSGAYQGRC